MPFDFQLINKNKIDVLKKSSSNPRRKKSWRGKVGSRWILFNEKYIQYLTLGDETKLHRKGEKSTSWNRRRKSKVRRNGMKRENEGTSLVTLLYRNLCEQR